MEVLAVNTAAGDVVITNGVLEPESIQVLLPASNVVVAPAVSVPLPIVKTPETVMEPVPPVRVVTVKGVAVPSEFEKVRLLNVQPTAPEAAPKFFAAAIRCSKVPPVRVIVPAPATEPLTVTF